jgi:hypothetical protein
LHSFNFPVYVFLAFSGRRMSAQPLKRRFWSIFPRAE